MKLNRDNRLTISQDSIIWIPLNRFRSLRYSLFDFVVIESIKGQRNIKRPQEDYFDWCLDWACFHQKKRWLSWNMPSPMPTIIVIICQVRSWVWCQPFNTFADWIPENALRLSCKLNLRKEEAPTPLRILSTLLNCYLQIISSAWTSNRPIKLSDWSRTWVRSHQYLVRWLIRV